MSSPRRTLVLVCRGPECGDKRGSSFVHKALAEEIVRAGVRPGQVQLAWQSCFGQCRRGVNVLVRDVKPGDDPFFVAFKTGGDRSALYHGVLPADAERIVREHIVAGRIVEELKRRGPT